MRSEKYEDFKKRVGKNCDNCGSLLCPNNESGLCKSCAMKKSVAERFGNKPKLNKKQLKHLEKIKRGYHKFEDLELIRMWEDGDSDMFIAKTLNVSNTVVTKRRYKLGLEANFRPFFGENLDAEQMKDRERDRLKQLEELPRKYRSHINNKKRYKNYKKSHGMKFINLQSRKSYNKLKRNSKLRCQDCNAKLAHKNKTFLCVSCSQKSFTDEEFYNLYMQGLGDYEIADILKVHPPAVWRRRTKFGLPNNNDLNLNGERKQENVLQTIQVKH